MGLPTLEQRAAGVLLHLTSLPGPHGNGDLGPQAYRFADFLAAAGQRWWLVLPVHPTDGDFSPYNALSAFAGNPLLIALQPLVEDGLLHEDELTPDFAAPPGYCDYAAAMRFRHERLHLAHQRFADGAAPHLHGPLAAFGVAHADWLDDYALFVALKGTHGHRAWPDWSAPLRRRDPGALAQARDELAGELAYRTFVQFLFDRQWHALKAYCAARGIGLIGDVPVFVAHDSADVWAHPELFHLDAAGQPTVVAGVPPDAFSATGQRWGNPLYRWPLLRERDYDWWMRRIAVTLSRFDAVRLDHFIGFHRYWEVPATARDARDGRFLPGPGAHFFRALEQRLGRLPLIAEDLGLVTREVEALRDELGLPGMRVLQFAFGEGPGDNPHLPYNHVPRSVVFTATHDHDTAAGWFHGNPGAEPQAAQPPQQSAERRYFLDYAGGGEREVHWTMVRMALASVAHTAIVPAQDLLGLGSEARMNRPGTTEGNWLWRLRDGELTDAVAARLRALTQIYGRAG